ncbi:hypothetical protein [Nocardia farcinica]|uniref:hypothetical protein n=1 Tax=Nocardia farcinica TaxID=37329 RepID=UPI002456B50F|nr:hypothetical protein [Nocardia farcinica]
MARVKQVISPMVLLWMLGVVVGLLAFMAGVLHLGMAIARWSGSDVAMALFLPVSAVAGIGAWSVVLSAAWWLRRRYLRRVGVVVPDATVVESQVRRKRMRALFDFDLWQVTVEARFSHPDSGREVRVRKQYSFHQFRAAAARRFADRLSVGVSAPVVVRRNAAMFDVPQRPIWVDIW